MTQRKAQLSRLVFAIATLLFCTLPLFGLSCSRANPAPTLTSIDPAQVTSLAPTIVTLTGSSLFASVHIDISSNDPPTRNAQWRCRVGPLEIPSAAIAWKSTERIDVDLPAGLPLGTHDVIAISPRGETAMLRKALTVVSEPIGLQLKIEDAPGGEGAPILTRTVSAGAFFDLYAVARDAEDAFVADVSVKWFLTSDIGTVDAGPSQTITFHATRSGTGRVQATTASSFAETGDIIVRAGEPIAVAIFDAPGGEGALVGDRTMTTDESLDLVAASVDAAGNWISDVPVTWAVTGGIGTLQPGPSTSALFEANVPGQGTVNVAHAELGNASTGTLTLSAGKAASLAAAPDTLTLSADDPPVTFTASGRDSDGNATTDLGNLTWTVATGPIAAIDATTGQFTPTHAGTGSIRASSSYGVSDDSGPITVIAGATATLAVAPDSLSLVAGGVPVAFAATGVDADGNPTLDLGVLTWSVSSGAITSLDGSSGVFTPMVAGTGTVRASSSFGIADDSGVIEVLAGPATTLTVAPDTLTAFVGGLPVAFTALGQDAFGNVTTSVGALTWSVASGPIANMDPATGIFTPTTLGSGTVRATSALGPTDDSGLVQVLAAASLVATLSVPAARNTAQDFDVMMTVNNAGMADALGVAPSALTQAGTSSALLKAGPQPASVAIPSGGSAAFTYTFVANTTGTVQFTGNAAGVDAMTSSPVVSADATSPVLTIQSPAALEATIDVPASVGIASSVLVKVTVTNAGEATAINVAPDALTITGTGAAAFASGPVPSSASLSGGASADFALSYDATAKGSIVFKATASGQDGNTAAVIISPEAASGALSIVDEGEVLTSNPFGDGTSFAYVFGHAGHVYLGPRGNGAGAVRFDPDGANHENIGFTFPRDTTGNSSGNTTTPPYTSIGATGCMPNSQSCGPDNEDGRGSFASGVFAGAEWLVVGGARSGGDLDYVYMSPDATTSIAFRYVDFKDLLGGNTRGFSAMHVFANRVYLAFPDDGGSRPYFLSLLTTPVSPGLEASSGADAIDLKIDKLPGISDSSPAMIDALGDYHDRLYIGNSSGWFRSMTSTPLSDVDFAVCTPTDARYASHVSVHTLKMSDIEPANRALSGIVVFQDRLFMGRNTVAGPQLWACNPGPNNPCTPADWSLVTPNTVGDTTLTQFDNPNNESISLLAATPTSLYVGFDNGVDGVVVFRATTAPATQADFRGAGGCSAAVHPAACQGLLGNGLGAPATRTRFFDAKALDFGAIHDVYAVVGDGAGPVDVVRFLD